jgi:hypothetical protein
MSARIIQVRPSRNPSRQKQGGCEETDEIKTQSGQILRESGGFFTLTSTPISLTEN